MTIQTSDYDKRQIALMEKQITFFQQGSIDLETLIARLEGLFLALENHKVPWEAFFWEEWDALESVLSDFLDEENLISESSHQEIVSNAINNLAEIFLKFCK